MQYNKDLYGVTADQRTFIEEEEALIDPIAKRLMGVLDVDLHGHHSDSRGGICYRSTFAGSLDGLQVSLHPNRIIEPDDDYWLEEEYQQFALLLRIGSETKSLVDRARSAIKIASDLNLTLVRSTYSADLEGDQPDVVEFELGAKEARS